MDARHDCTPPHKLLHSTVPAFYRRVDANEFSWRKFHGIIADAFTLFWILFLRLKAIIVTPILFFIRHPSSHILKVVRSEFAMDAAPISKLCVASNIGWMIISTIGVIGGVSHGSADHLFALRYVLAFVSSAVSLVSIKLWPKRALGRLSILLFAPFILIEVAEIMAVYKCSSGIESVWGIDCSELVMYSDSSRYLEMVTDQLAVLFLALANVWILWRCHMTDAHMIYDMKKMRKTASAEPFLSAVSSDAGVSEFISADEEGASPKKFSAFTRARGMSQPAIVRSLNELRPEEARSVTELQTQYADDASMKKLSVHDWLRLAWCRSLDTQKASEVLTNHKYWIEKWNLNEVAIETIRENFKAGFSVVAGRDFDGRPMLWQRMQFMNPSEIPLAVGIKSTWLAMDAALADLESNRTGICLIYDFTNVGMNNISLNLFDVRDGSLSCGAGHPSHITRVLFLNPPMVFKLGFNAAKPLLPTSVSSIVSMVNISATNQNTWYETLCPKTQLPEYLGGEQRGDYFSWLTRRLEGSRFLYHPAAIGQSEEGWKTPTDEAES